MKLIQIKDYLLLIDEEAEIKPEDYIIHDTVEGVVEANDEWHYRGEKDDYWNKVIAYYPLTKEAKELDLLLLPNPFKEGIDIEKLAKEHGNLYVNQREKELGYLSFCEGYKAAQPKQFSLEDMINAFDEGTNVGALSESLSGEYDSYEEMENADEYFDESRETFIQSLSTQQLPKEFVISDMEYLSTNGSWEDVRLPLLKDFVQKANLRYKTITNSEGKQELVGDYKY